MRPLLFAILLSCGCSTATLRAYRQTAAFEEEYSTDIPGGVLPGGTRVLYPAWLAEADRPQVLAGVESYLAPLRAAYPGAPWPDLVVLIHPACPFMAPWKARVLGCRHGPLVVVSWARKADGTPRTRNPWPTLPHEALHWIAATTGQDSRDGSAWMMDPGRLALDRQAQAVAAPCPVGEASRTAARAYVYRPWTE